MEKKTIQSILSSPFALDDWQNLLTAVFGVKNFFQTPSEIPLPNNSKAEAACELGSFNTADDRIIGLYLVKLKPEVWLERNKVGLRELLRSVYKYDVDGALIVFEQADKWRLSFVSEIRTFDNEGQIIEQKTEPKRYTYLLGKDEKTKTPTDRLFAVAGKKLYLKEILDVFSVEALNKDFYKIVATQFYKLVGATEGKGKKATTYDKILQLPSVNSDEKKVYQEFAVRLIGRTVFCWFLKKKKSATGKSLLPEHLLSSKAVKENSNYYHSILEKLFFQTLNTPMDKRIDNLPKGCEQIPFLNGGLFEPQSDDYYLSNKFTGDSSHINTLKIPDEWFFELFTNLEQYNFTIDENSIADVEVSVDPEMLGRIFENLLAEIDPDSGESARKATGSYYTPREIVDYMATESLTSYLFTQLQNKNETLTIEQNDLKALFKLDESKDEIAKISNYKTDILNALDNLKILDPACGSGAFPMGMLQKIVMVLQKLDPNSEWWKNKQLEKIENVVFRKQAKEKLEHATVEYAQKIGIIQNSMYGVDIQPIAAEISKLRCFLTLIVDENIDDTKPNRGVEPLPNLEFKFVTADTLRQLPQENDFGGLFNSNDNLNKLQKIRLAYLQSYGEEKNALKERFLNLQKQTYNEQIKLGGATNLNSKAYKISTWDPFNHKKTDWFDPKWMFGVEKFDVVIGNPPYVEAKKLKDIASQLRNYEVATGTSDLSVYFIEKGLNLCKSNGELCYITTNKFFNTGYGKPVRKFLTKNQINRIVDFEQVEVFDNVLVSSVVVGVKKSDEQIQNFTYQKFYKLKKDDFRRQFVEQQTDFGKYEQRLLTDSEWSFSDNTQLALKEKIENAGTRVFDLEGVAVFRGVTTGYNPAFIIDTKKKNELIFADTNNAKIIKPLLQGRNIRKWIYNYNDENLIFIPWHFPLHLDNSISGASDVAETSLQNNYPSLYNHLLKHKNELSERNQEETGIRYEWYALQRCAASYYPEFEKSEKIIWGLTADKWAFAYDDKQHYLPSNGYILTSEKISIKYLLALLNSNVLRYYFGFIGVTTAGGAYTLKHATIEQLPIVIAKQQQPIISLVEKILSLKKANLQVDTSELEKEIDKLVYELYGLTEEEIKIVEGKV